MGSTGTKRNGPDPLFLTDPDWMGKYLGLLRCGCKPYIAAEMNEVPRGTLYNWLRWGGYPVLSDGEIEREPFIRFVKQTLQAEAEAHAEIIGSVHRKVQNDVNAAIRYLRTRYADDYVRSQPPVVISERDASVTISPETFRQLQKDSDHDHNPHS